VYFAYRDKKVGVFVRFSCAASSGNCTSLDKFKDGFNSDYYGLWRNGIVTNIKDPN
jgi:hypothetical protein